jgi:hypothetical protein
MVPYDVPTAVCYSSFTFFSDFLWQECTRHFPYIIQ